MTGVDNGNAYTEYDKPITMQDILLLREITKAHNGERVSINDFTSEDIQKAQKWAYKYWNGFKESGVNPCISPFFRVWFGDYRSSENAPVTIADIPKYIATNESRKANRGNATNNDTKWDISISRAGETNTIAHSGEQGLSEYGLSGIRSLVENAILLDSEVHEHHSNDPKNDLIAFDHKLYALGKSNIGIALYKITVEEYYHDHKHTNERVFHNLKYIEKVADVGGRTAGHSLPGVSTNDIVATDYSISDLYSLVKTYDKEFHPGNPVHPALLNKDGTPKKFYHGTNERFTVFSPDELNPREGSYFFAENIEDARAYGKNVYEVYLNAEKLADYDNQPSEFYKLKSKREQVEYLKAKGYDGWYSDMDSRGWGEVSVFSNTQIKSATDNIGTFDRSNPDIRYSRALTAFDQMAKENAEMREKLADYRDTVRQTRSPETPLCFPRKIWRDPSRRRAWKICKRKVPAMRGSAGLSKYQP